MGQNDLNSFENKTTKMKLYVVNPDNEEKIYLKYEAESRRELEFKIGSYEFFINNFKYNVDDVKAEEDKIASITGAVSGAVIGTYLLPGAGTLIGATFGGLLGLGLTSGVAENDKIRVWRFNLSKSKTAINKS